MEEMTSEFLFLFFLCEEYSLVLIAWLSSNLENMWLRGNELPPNILIFVSWMFV